MGRLAAVAVIGVVTLLVIAWVQADEATLQVSMRLRNGTPAIVSFDVTSDGSYLTGTLEDHTLVYSNSTYRMDFSESAEEKYSILRLRISRKDGRPFELPGFALSVRVPANDLKGIWYPSAPSLSNDVMAADGSSPVRGIADANEGIPYIAGAAIDGQNIIAIGLARQDLPVEIEADPLDLDRLQFRLHARSRRTAQVFEESFYISNDTSINWFDAAANYADWADQVNGYSPMPVSSIAYEPLYDLWYFAQDRVDDNLYLSSAGLAGEVGLGSFLADSGWDAPAGEYGRWLAGRTGDYDPPPDRFRNLKETFDQIRSAHRLNVQLWLQPFAVGRESERYGSTKDLHIQVPSKVVTIPGWGGFGGAPFYLPASDDNLENVNLCPRLQGTHTYLYQLIREVADKYKPDGYWLDFIDGMPTFCTASHVHDVESFGEGLRLSLGAIRSAIQDTTPNAVVQFRANYANLNNKAFANVWQPEDSPGNFDQMRLKALRMRPFSRGVAFASDQLYWNTDLNDSDVSRFIMTAVMIGVPAFGPDLSRMPYSAREIIKAWMRFYRSYQNELIHGRFAPFGRLPVPNHRIESEYRSFVYLRNLDSPLIEVQTRKVYLLNATESDHINARVRVPDGTRDYHVITMDRFLNPTPGVMKVTVTEEGTLDLDIIVEMGGMAILIG
jgi:hypothetical protein